MMNWRRLKPARSSSLQLKEKILSLAPDDQRIVMAEIERMLEERQP
jgi:hypothetical protein